MVIKPEERFSAVDSPPRRKGRGTSFPSQTYQRNPTLDLYLPLLICHRLKA
jgi:hypothetical protein